MRRKHPRRAFTLLELLVVLGILALLLTLVAPRVIGHLGESKPVVTRQQIQNTATALESFRLDVGRYPTPEEGLKSLIERPEGVERWKGPYLSRSSVPQDGWGRELRYRVPASQGGFDFEVYSFGADDKEGGEGENADLYSWQ